METTPKQASLGPALVGLAVYLVAAKVMAGVHDEGLSSLVVLTHVQALIDAEVLYLQNSEQRGEPGQRSQKFFSLGQLE